MKRKWYRSAGWKALLLALAYAAAALAAAAGMLLLYQYYLGYYPLQAGTSYEESGAMTSDIAADAEMILNELCIIREGEEAESEATKESEETVAKENQEDTAAAKEEKETTVAEDDDSTDDTTIDIRIVYMNDAIQSLQDLLGEGVTNLTYLYVDKEAEKVYTNRSDFASYKDYQSSVQSIADGGAYFVIYPPQTSSETDLPGWKEGEQYGENQVGISFREMQLHAEEYRLSEDYIFAVGLDTDYPLNDTYARTSWNYNGLQKVSGYVFPALICALLIFVAAVVWLTIAAGRRPADEEVHRNFYDRIHTEIYLLITAVSVADFCVEAVEIFRNVDLSEVDYGSSLKLLLAVTGAVGAGAAVVSSVFYLSLVRRIKAKSLYQDSLLRWVFVLLGKLGRKAAGAAALYSRNTAQKLQYSAWMVVLIVCLTSGFFTMWTSWSSAGLLLGFLLISIPYAAAFVFVLREADGQDRILEGLARISGGELTYKIPEEKLRGKARQQAGYINHISQGLDAAVAKSMKDERMKTELITNVSHDLKTPLTSIINYVDLLKRENIDDPKIQGYLKVLDEKSQRLKVLTEDVVEASRASTGNITLNMANLDFTELVRQVMAEVQERFDARGLAMIVDFPEDSAVISADGQRLWRVLENVFANAAKYALEGTRVYVEVKKADAQAVFTLKNISAQPLNISADELTERFIRGDVSRSTEGSGLGLSIAKSLTELMEGSFTLYLDGDLFKVTVAFAQREQ